MGFSGASILNGGRGAYNPSPNNLLGGVSADGGDELHDGSTYCNPVNAALGMGCTTSGTPDDFLPVSAACTRGGVNCCMADGSVRFISNYIDEVNWCRLISKADGQIVTVNDL